MDEVKWLLVGPGDIAQKRVAPALAAAARSRLTGIVYHTRREAAESLARTFHAEAVYDDFDRALRDSDADAVYLATPVFLHTPQGVAALKSGRHVLVEKPLALSAADARPLLDAARASNLRAGCAYYRRFFPRYAHAREMLARGALGRVVLARIVYHSWFDPAPDDPKRWRVERARSGGGPLADMASHLFDMLIGLLGLPRSVFARCDNLVHSDWDVEDSASVLMALDGGAQAVASVGWNSKAWRHEFEIVGTEARLTWSPGDTGPVTTARGRDKETLDLPNAENVHRPLVQDFVDAVLDGGEPAVPVAEAAKTNVLLDAVYRSARKRREVALPATVGR